jgi:hypothetical protein
MKKCTKCCIIKEYTEFNKSSRNSDGYRAECRLCQNEQSKRYYNDTIEFQKLRKKEKLISPKKQKELIKQELNKRGLKKCGKCQELKSLNDFGQDNATNDKYSSNCRQCRSINGQKNYQNNPEKYINKSQNYYKNNREICVKKSSQYKMNRRKTDDFYRFKHRLRRALYDFMREQKWEKNTTLSEYLGCSMDEFKRYMELKFQDNMTWENYGKNGWQIDHIVPLSLADTPEKAIKLCHYTNLQPLWAKDNLLKSNKIIPKIRYLEKFELLPNEISQKSILNSIINVKTNRIFARNCEIKIINLTLEKPFLNSYHFHGYNPSSICYGIFYNDELVSVMSFGKPRFNKDYEWELLRFCTKLNTIVVGGASKLFQFFIKNNNPKNIISYCDLRYGTGNVYEKLGMQLVEKTVSNYSYIKDNEVLSRYQCMKSKLQDRLALYIDDLSESDNMYINGYEKVYDLGNNKYIWSKK